MRDPHLLSAVVAHTDRSDLSGLHGVGHQHHQPGDVDPPRREVVLVQVDRIALQAIETGLERGGEVFGAGQRAGRKLGRHHHRLACGELAQPALGPTAAVHGCGVKEIDTRRQACLERSLLITGIGTTIGRFGRHQTLQAPGDAPGHHTQPQLRDVDLTPSQPHCLCHPPLPVAYLRRPPSSTR